MPITILTGIVVLSVILLVHELGHFTTAKATGVRVEEFGLGFPPRLLSFKRGETRYSLNAIPFGGFNKLTGEEDPADPRSLAGKSRGVRLLVLSGGSLMNFLLALVLFSTSYLIPREVIIGQVMVEEVVLNSPADMAGIRTGDIILQVNNKPVGNNNELHQHIIENLGKNTILLIQHPDSTRESIQLVPRWEPPEGEGAIGIAMTTINPTTVIRRYPFWQVIPLGAARVIETVVLWVDGLASMFTGKVEAALFGPVGIAQLTGEVAQFGIIPLLEIAALISLVLGIMNLFPLPAIDGGRITFLFLELIRRGKRISPKTEGMVHLVGLAMLMLFLFAITYQDIMRLISGESLIP
ncbi:RIP metalloprotease [Chloroflexota bacterium]